MRSVILAMACLAACVESNAAEAADPLPLSIKKMELLYQDDFDGDLSQWVIEQMEGGTASIKMGGLDIEDKKGCTVWFKEKLDSPVMIEFEVVMIDEGKEDERVSDLNCFWMAKDTQHPGNIFESDEDRGGSFKKYHHLRLYYVGYGANKNKTTRFRRYPGDGTRDVLPEHDLSDAKWMNIANQTRKIQIVSIGKTVQYICDGEVVYDFVDEAPYTDGWFGFRTVRNHMRIDNFRVSRIALAE